MLGRRRLFEHLGSRAQGFVKPVECREDRADQLDQNLDLGAVQMIVGQGGMNLADRDVAVVGGNLLRH